MSKQTFHLPTWRRKPTADEAAPPRRGQRHKSPAKLDFYGEFHAAHCDAPALSVPALPECGRRCFGFHSEEIFLWEKKSPELI